MATVAQCLYCFESLSASLEHRKPLNLAQVEAFWRRYCTTQLQHGSADETSGQMELEGEENGSDEEDTELIELNSKPLKAQETVASISKSAQQSDLKASGPLSSPSSSSSSTPSAASKASSMRTDSSVSMSSSRSSLSSASQTRSNVKKARSPHSERHPMFITWTSIGSNNSRTLRGCIGTFESQILDEGLGTYALTSAFEDVRFPPISVSELPSLECSVTLLTDFKPAPTPLSWEIGTHGLRIAFTHQSKRYGATYLPDVAQEQGWTKTETMISLMRKAGWSGKRDDWQNVGDLSVVRYQGHKANASYETWRIWRDWVDERANSS